MIFSFLSLFEHRSCLCVLFIHHSISSQGPNSACSSLSLSSLDPREGLLVCENRPHYSLCPCGQGHSLAFIASRMGICNHSCLFSMWLHFPCCHNYNSFGLRNSLPTELHIGCTSFETYTAYEAFKRKISNLLFSFSPA